MEQAQQPVDVYYNQHPLQNHVVLQKVFAFLQTLATIQELKNVRLVCKAWHTESLAIWRATAVVNLVPDDIPNDKLLSPGVTLKGFVATFNNPFYNLEEKPFQKYKLHFLEIDLAACETDSVLSCWVNSVGQHISHLILSEVNFKTESGSNSEILRFFIEKFPNLVNLCMELVTVDGSRLKLSETKIKEIHQHISTLTWSNNYGFQFSNFPYLEIVSLKNLFLADVAKLMNYLDESDHPVPTTNASIKNLHLVTRSSRRRNNRRLNNSIQQIFENSRFSALQHLSINQKHGLYVALDFQHLSVFLSTHSETLKFLEIFASIREPAPEIYLISTEFPGLKEIRVCGNAFRNLDFLQLTPNLKILHMDLYGYERQEEMMTELTSDSMQECAVSPVTDDIVQLTENVDSILLEEMEHLQINYQLNSKSLEILASWMPNLKILKLVFNPETFSVACENWPELEHLECLFGSTISNENISGTKNSSDVNGRKVLADLQNLKTFNLHTECGKGLLSDECCTGFLRLPKLANLRICVSSTLSNQAEMELQKYGQNVKVYRNHGLHQSNIHNWPCCQNERYQQFIFGLKPKSTNTFENVLK